MHARIPLDVDLEDKLIYGLTPARLVYLVLALLAAFATWSTHWAPPAIRVIAAAFIAASGAVAAWGSWRGRPVDGWVVDLTLFAIASYRIAWRR